MSPKSSTSTSAPAYHEIHVRTLRVGEELPFALYTRIEGEYLVYRREHLMFGQDQLEALLKNRIEVLFVSDSQIAEFTAYLSGNVSDAIADHGPSLAERAPLFYHSMGELTRQALTIPVIRDNVATASNVVKSNLAFLEEGKAALHALMGQMNADTTIHHKALNSCQYGIALARKVGIANAREIEAFGMGLLFMNLGMQQLPQALQHKEGPLSFDEWTVIKRHPAIAMEMLDNVDGIPDLTRAVVIGHQERLDGSGYPQALTGNELSLALRIAGIVDTFNALTTHPGDKTRTSFEALREMSTSMRDKLDRNLLNSFVELLQAEDDV